ncbi:MAG: VIT domain-containing protein [Ignavibacteriales bacterium]|nr:VIT domain-containing protein [Ignavibacteriales bacterium]
MLSRFTKIIILSFILAANLPAQYNLTVQDPQATWYQSKGTIEEAVFSVGPKGLYSQVSMYLTFSARGGNFLNGSQLETVMNFDLPEGSFVTDLWLWIGDKISKGIMLDVWSASSIYEGIVQRRRDPALLIKKGTKSYELRVYPMDKNSTRKVRITYLVPNTWNETSVSTPLPVELLKVSLNKVNTARVITWTTSEWTNPSVSGVDGVFQSQHDTFFDEHTKLDINNPNTSYPYSLNFNNPMINGVYFKYYKTAQDGFYQLSLIPAASQNVTNKKVLYLIDYDSRKSTTTRSQILSDLKQMLLTNAKPGDNFNLFYSGLSIGKLSSDWLNADAAGINGAFQSINENSLSTYSNLPTLLREGYDFLIKKGGGLIYLISNSDQLGSNLNANQVISDIKNILTINIPTYVLDYNDKDITYFYFNNRSYLGNEYLYDNLSKLTGGYFQHISGGFYNTLNDLHLKLNGTISSFDLYTTLDNGFCYSRQTLANSGSTISMNKPIIQIGKFLGEFPFIIKTSGIYNSVPFTQSMIIEDANNKMGESAIEKMWVNSYIKSLEVGTPNNSTVTEILNLGIEHKILTNYTAFLALEDTTSICRTCYYDDGKPIGFTDVKDEKQIPTDFSLSAYPNPFNSQVAITIKIPMQMLGQNFTFKIYNLLGQVVKTFTVNDLTSVIKLFWDGKNDEGQLISSGVYIFTIASPSFTKSLKLMYMK